MSSFNWSPLQGGSGGVATYPNLAAFPASAATGTLAVALDSGILYEFFGGSWQAVAAPGDVLSLGSPANGLSLSANVLTLGLASSGVTGALSGTDWNTFNSKQAALSITNLTDAGTDGITITNGTGAVIGASPVTISQHVADTTHSGYLSSADWNTFNSKAPSFSAGNLTDAGTDGITVTGGTGAVIGSGTAISQHVADASHNGYLASTDWSTFNSKQAALTIGNLTDAGTDGITVTGGTGSVIGSGVSISQHVADSTHNGYLSSTDWSTFNGKQPAGTYVTSISIASSNGFAGTSSGGATPSLTLSTSVTGILYGNGTSVAAAIAANFPTLNQNTSGTAAGLSATLAIASGGTNQTAFTAKSGNVAGLVFFDGTSLANDATVTDIGYDTVANSLKAKNADVANALTIGVAGTSIGSIALSGNTSGTVTIKTQAAAGTYEFDLPITAGSSGQVLTSAGGAGSPMTWSTVAANGFNYLATSNTSVYGGTNGTLSFTGADNTIVGSSAGANLNNTATDNSFFGWKAGFKTTSGAQNTYIGSLAGPNSATASTGGSNTFIGYSTGFAITSGHDNVFIGNAAGNSSIGGVGIVGIGSGAAQSSVGNYSVIIGTSATDAGAANSIILGLSKPGSSSYTGSFLVGQTGDGSIIATSTAANQIVFGTAGAQAIPLKDMFLGRGAVGDGTATNVSIQPSPMVGSNLAGASLTIKGGNSTGSGLGGSLIFQTSPATGSSSTANTPTTAMTIDSTQKVTFAGATNLPGNGTALKAPTVQTFTSGSGTYTTPTSPAPLYIKVRLVGGGGGGGAGGTSGGNGSAGGDTTFGTSLLVGGGGGGGAWGGQGGAGGSASLGSGPIGLAMPGSDGMGAFLDNASGGQVQSQGGSGGNSPIFAGAGQKSERGTATGAAGRTNSGGGGQGGPNATASGSYTGGGGGSGGVADAIINSPSATYAYAVGAAGAAGTGGSGNGGPGGSGVITVEEHYQ